MDSRDEKRIYEELNTIKENEAFALESSNEIVIDFKNITEHINSEQEKITKFINNIQNSISKQFEENYREIYLLQYLNKLNFNIDWLTDHINNLAESMLLAKLNILPKFILDEIETRKIK